MSTIIYPSPIFGPVHSRRLGVSLGINLLPGDGKFCTFDCIYCECGFNGDHRPHQSLPTRTEVKEALEKKLIDLKAELFNLRFSNATGSLSNPLSIVTCKRDIAKVKTVLRERELGLVKSVEPVVEKAEAKKIVNKEEKVENVEKKTTKKASTSKSKKD